MKPSVTGWALVGVQGVLLAVIALWPASIGPGAPRWSVAGVVFVAVGAAAAAFALIHLGPALTPVPEPNGAGLRASGIYHWVRHPMYASLIAIAAGVACLRASSVVWLAAGLLVVLFEIKSRFEERHLRVAYPAYAEYAKRTGKYLPSLRR